jgi:hypothetical protein
MELKVGDKVKYIFPEPKNMNENEFIGIVETVSKDFIYLKNELNIRLKVSYKNFHLIKIISTHFGHSFIHSEIFFG